MIILGIDPGLADTGYGIIKKQNNSLSLVDFGCIKTNKMNSFSERLGQIVKKLEKIISIHKPNIAAIEELFFCKNVKTAIIVGQARGAAIVACYNEHIPVHEYTPLEVKQAITGYGRAEKCQIQEMVKIILRLKNIPKPDHAADALAIAICCTNTIK